MVQRIPPDTGDRSQEAKPHDGVFSSDVGATAVRRAGYGAWRFPAEGAEPIREIIEARHRFAMFSDAEARAIVAYLRWRCEAEESAGFAPPPLIDQALRNYWSQRSPDPPTAITVASTG